MVWCNVKNVYPTQHDWLKEIKKHAQNTITTLGSIVTLIGGDLYDHYMSKRNCTLVSMNKTLTWDVEIMREVTTYNLDLDSLIILLC